MRSLNDVPIVAFLIYFTSVLLMVSDAAQTDYEAITKDIIKKINIETTVFDNETYRKSDHYYYTREVCMNSQPPKILNTFLRNKKSNFVNLSKFEHIEQFYTAKVSLFPIKYYGGEYAMVRVTQQGIINLGEKSLGSIWALTGDSELAKMQIVNNDKEFAVRWPNLTVVSDRK